MKLLNLIDIKETDDGTGYIFETEEGLPVFTTDKKLHDKQDGKNKWKIGVSISSGCPVGCAYCFTNKFDFYKKLGKEEIIEQVDFISGINIEDIEKQRFDEIKVEMKEMGDPLLNQNNVVGAIEDLHKKYPDFVYVVSTSAPYNPQFFEVLKELRDEGIQIRLQFSCHTTSNEQRKILSSNLRMMDFADISDVVDKWYDADKDQSLVTLNFVPMQGYELDADKLRQYFDPEKVFVKISYLDINEVNKANSIYDKEEAKVRDFIQGLEKQGFKYAYRHGRSQEEVKPCRIYGAGCPAIQSSL